MYNYYNMKTSSTKSVRVAPKKAVVTSKVARKPRVHNIKRDK